MMNDLLPKISTYYSMYSSTGYTCAETTTDHMSLSKSIDNTKDKQMNRDNRPVHLYFHRNIAELGPYTEGMDEDIENMPRKIIICNSWAELTEKLKLNPKTIAFDESELANTSAIEIINMVRTLSTLVGITDKIYCAVTVSKNTNIKVIKELQKSDITGIIPNHGSFGWDEAKKAVLALWANIPYWPKHILDQLPGNKKKIDSNHGSIKLTPRQQQILNLIKERGLSNKIIAKTLNISESTVKLHVGIVLKKFNVKNRTQLALFSGK